MNTNGNQALVEPLIPRGITISPAASNPKPILVSAAPTKARPGSGLVLTILLGLAGFSLLSVVLQAISPHPVTAWGMTVDRLSAVLTLLVASVGLVTYRFSIRYLDGDMQQRRFLAWLAFSIISAYALMLSTNLILLAAAWSLTSFGLHKLLTHYPDRAEGVRAARKKFLISRVGDLALAGAIATIWWNWHTLDLNQLLEDTAGMPAQPATTWVALLIVLAALTKSAQFPFHSWLPETMESPTPVSALMHAGIINAGGALLLRLSPLVIQAPPALLLLAVVGTITATLGTLSMWAQVKVKRTLAWSTVSQMGFMMVQCGLGAFPAALLHILAHGCYKAWSFLRSGDVPAPPHSPATSSATRVLLLAALGTAMAIPALSLASWITGFSPLHSPGELALTIVLALSVGQVIVALYAAPGTVNLDIKKAFAGLITLLTVPLAAFALYRSAGIYLSPVVGALVAPTGLMAWAAAIVPIAALLFLTVVHAFLPMSGQTPMGRALRVHALHGFYFGAIADRVVARVWRIRLKGI